MDPLDLTKFKTDAAAPGAAPAAGLDLTKFKTPEAAPGAGSATSATTPATDHESLLQKHLWGPLSDIVNKREANVETAVDQYSAGKQSLGETALQTAGQAAGALGDVAGKAIGVVGKQYAKGVLGPAYETVASGAKNTLMGFLGLKPVKEAAAAVEKVAAEHPRAAADVGAVADIAAVLPIDLVAEQGAKAAKGAAGAAAETAGEVTDAMKAAKAAKAAGEADRLAAAISQGSSDEIKATKAAVSQIDTSGVKTFKDLQGEADSKISALAAAQDKEFAAAKAATHLDLDYFDKDIGRGVKFNPVKQGIADLEGWYEETKQFDKLKEIRDLKARADQVGLDASEVNQLARDYNTQFSAKTFSAKTGDLKMTTQAKAYENTRTALKEATRDLMPTDAARELDKQMSNLYTLRDNASAMAEKVHDVMKKMQSTGILKKLQSAGATLLDVGTLGIPKTFLKKFVPIFRPGVETMDVLEIQKNLAGNLKKLDKVLQMGAPELEREMSGASIGQRVKEFFAPSGE